MLALALVDALGDGARAQVTWLRDTYPNATPEGLGNVTVRRFLRQARVRGAVAGFAGPLGMLVDTGTQNWSNARLVLHLAAAYGLDPTARDRAADLLVLQGVHRDVSTAQSAIDAAASNESAAGPPGRRAARGTALARFNEPLTGVLWAGVVRAGAASVASRLIPGAGMLVGALADSRSVERVAVRARQYYRLRARMSAEEAETIMQEGVSHE
ncbi:MAG TPA: EcsC family protein [Micromonosporaceae bacterium]|nr:EcsC family protein [Micromonosporaceae bacterium]